MTALDTHSPAAENSRALVRATKAGGCRSGSDSHGALVHLIDNPRGLHVYQLGPALCGTMPKIMWSDWAPERLKVCGKCQRAALAEEPGQ